MQGRAETSGSSSCISSTTNAGRRANLALENYLPQRPYMFGKCYRDVPYDNEMLQTNSAVCKMNDKAYTLPNLREVRRRLRHAGRLCRPHRQKHGSSRRVRSGANRTPATWHAWVMWVEVRQVNKSSISFTLESYGRYRGRQLLRRHARPTRRPARPLPTANWSNGCIPSASAPATKGTQVLIMKSYPMLREMADMDITDQFVFSQPGDWTVSRHLKNRGSPSRKSPRKKKSARRTLSGRCSAVARQAVSDVRPVSRLHLDRLRRPRLLPDQPPQTQRPVRAPRSPCTNSSCPSCAA